MSTCFRAVITFLSSSVTMTPSEMTLSTLFFISLFRLKWSSREGSLVRALQNSSMLLRLCSTEFIKQVFPKFLSPTLFRGELLLTVLSRFSFFDVLGFFAGTGGFTGSNTLFLRTRNDLPGASFSASSVSFLVRTSVLRFSKNLRSLC